MIFFCKYSLNHNKGYVEFQFQHKLKLNTMLLVKQDKPIETSILIINSNMNQFTLGELGEKIRMPKIMMRLLLQA